MKRLTALVLLAAALALAAEPDWRSATVVYTKRDVSSSTPVAGTSSQVQAITETFDIDAGDVVYTVEESVVPTQTLRFPEGFHVLLSIDKKKVTLKLANGKTRNLKLVAEYPKPAKPSK